jgi:hypothetical protein
MMGSLSKRLNTCLAKLLLVNTWQQWKAYVELMEGATREVALQINEYKLEDSP